MCPRKRLLSEERRKKRRIVGAPPQLAKRKGAKSEVHGPAGERLANPLEQRQIGGAREQEAPGAAVAIDGALDGNEKLRRTLHLVDGEGLVAGQETLRIFPRRGELGEVVERHVPARGAARGGPPGAA